jgi:hypothetical protein
VQGLQHADELAAQSILEGHAVGVEVSREHGDFFVLNVHALNRADSFRELEDLWFAEWFSGEPAAVALVYDRWVQALFDGGPDRE